MTVDELKRAAMHLDPTERASLARELLASLDALSEPEVERLWLEEAERRRLLVEAGETRLVPMDEVFAQARARRVSRPLASSSILLLSESLMRPSGSPRRDAQACTRAIPVLRDVLDRRRGHRSVRNLTSESPSRVLAEPRLTCCAD